MGPRMVQHPKMVLNPKKVAPNHLAICDLAVVYIYNPIAGHTIFCHVFCASLYILLSMDH